MKKTLTVSFVLLVLATANAGRDTECHSEMVRSCYGGSNTGLRPLKCNARNGGIDEVERDMQGLVNIHLNRSLGHLKTAAAFGTTKRNRPGFQRLFNELSDHAFGMATTLISHLAMSGGQLDPNVWMHNIRKRSAGDDDYEDDDEENADDDRDDDVLHRSDMPELLALARALDREKRAAKKTRRIHKKATHSKRSHPETAHFMQNKAMTEHAGVVRKLSGYVSDLAGILEEGDTKALGGFVFDRFLEAAPSLFEAAASLL